MKRKVIVRVELNRSQADNYANTLRETHLRLTPPGQKMPPVRVVSRTIKALGAAREVWVVVTEVDEL